jgi:hypothetical protein
LRALAFAFFFFFFAGLMCSFPMQQVRNHAVGDNPLIAIKARVVSGSRETSRKQTSCAAQLHRLRRIFQRGGRK